MSSTIKGSEFTGGAQQLAAVNENMPNVEANVTTGASQVCYFVDRLPRNVRNNIYRMFFRVRHAIVPFRSPMYDGMSYFSIERRLAFCSTDNREYYECPVEEMVPRDGLGLLTCCKKVSEEACAILYGENYFVFHVNGNSNFALGGFYDIASSQTGGSEASINHEMARSLYYYIFHRGIRQKSLIFEDSTIPQFFRQIGIKNTSSITKVGVRAYFIDYQLGFEEVLKGTAIVLKHLCPRLSRLTLDADDMTKTNDLHRSGPFRGLSGRDFERLPYHVVNQVEHIVGEIFSIFAQGIPSLCRPEPSKIDDSSVIVMFQLEQEHEWLAPRV
ncbi:hypothetical protein HYALB_00010761 [Hymenoscyphus albidus]|uniref:Uncharacterized protein n=1 Tax=Hymenoscyphus albidus TaxID=595503 RepID=A0A9N9LKB6_9HELO|nr:hypothetical protein HYALB_00010761 [Hymenoscyphus albidus]